MRANSDLVSPGVGTSPRATSQSKAKTGSVALLPCRCLHHRDPGPTCFSMVSRSRRPLSSPGTRPRKARTAAPAASRRPRLSSYSASLKVPSGEVGQSETAWRNAYSAASVLPRAGTASRAQQWKDCRPEQQETHLNDKPHDDRCQAFRSRFHVIAVQRRHSAATRWRR
jgi:hypothetical protein